MNIILNEQAERALKMNKIANNTGGIFKQDALFVWFIQIEGMFDCGEETSFDKAFKHLKI